MADDDKNMKKISLNDVKSKLILKKIVDNILKIKLLNIIHYNKTLQTRLNIDINTYKDEYSKIIIEMSLSNYRRKSIDDLFNLDYNSNNSSDYSSDEDNYIDIEDDDYKIDFVRHKRRKRKKEVKTYKVINIDYSLSKFYHIYFDKNEKESSDNSVKDDDEKEVSKVKVIIDNEVESLYNLFNDISIVVSIYFVRLARNNIKNMKKMFDNCKKLYIINFKKFNTEMFLI